MVGKAATIHCMCLYNMTPWSPQKKPPPKALLPVIYNPAVHSSGLIITDMHALAGPLSALGA